VTLANSAKFLQGQFFVKCLNIGTNEENYVGAFVN